MSKISRRLPDINLNLAYKDGQYFLPNDEVKSAPVLFSLSFTKLVSPYSVNKTDWVSDLRGLFEMTRADRRA